MNRLRVIRPVVLASATLVALSSWLLGGTPAAASPVDQSLESVLVSGTGAVFGEPDTLSANFAVETTAPTVDKALDSANTAATRMRDALKRAKVTGADLQTTAVGVRAKQNEKEEITGYTASQGLIAKIRNLPKAGAIMSAAITAGGDAARLNGVSFAIEDETTLLSQARKKAFADARGKAELYAAQAGRPLGRVVKVSEETSGYGYGGGSAAQYSVAADSAVPIEPGRQRVAVTVTVEWAFQPA